MANTFELIASSTVGAGGAANITFSSIASSWTDLCLKVSVRSNNSDGNVYDQINLFFNNVNDFTTKVIQGSGSTVASYQPSGSGVQLPIITGNSATANTFGNFEIYIPNYAGSTNKSFSIDSVNENNATTAYSQLDAGLWSNTSAINAIKMQPSVGTLFLQYSTAYLYGVKNA